MGSITHSIEVNAPLKAVYNQWTQFEEFPHFMEGVEEVRQQGDKHLFWRAKIGGKEKTWEAEITNQVPDQRIAWQSVSGAPNSGEVNFEAIDAQRTRVTLALDYEPEGLLEKAGDAVGITSGRVEGDLKRFRDYIESKGGASGWRGQVEGNEPLVAPAVTNEAAGVTPDNQASTVPPVNQPFRPGEVADAGDEPVITGVLPVAPRAGKAPTGS